MEEPERIYINDVQSRKWFAMASTTDIEYVRADLLAAKDAELEKMRERLDLGHEYLMTVEQDEFSADEALEAFGWTADGLNLMPWAESRAALKGVE